MVRTGRAIAVPKRAPRERQSQSVRSASRDSENGEQVRMLQNAVGNQSVQALAERGELSERGDAAPAAARDDSAEQEAERVAAAVTAASNAAAPANRSPGADRSPGVRSPANRGARVDREPRESGAEGSTGAAPGTEQAIRSAGGGRQLPAGVRSELEPQFGADFGDVRIHTGERAATLSDELGAEAFTYGSDVYFGEGSYRPETAAGRGLLAHELTHVLQQTDGQRGRTVQRQLLEPATGEPEPQETAGIDRDWLIQRIGFRMNLAFTKYVDACAAHQRRLREIAKQQAEMAGLVLDVLFAFAAPGLGRLVARGIGSAVPKAAPDAVYRVALGAMDRSDQIVSASTAVGKHVAKNAFESAVRRTESEAFVQTLKQDFSVALDRIHGNLQHRSDEELAVLYFNYDPEIATFDYYEEQMGQLVDRYQAQVEPIGKRKDYVGMEFLLQTENRAFWIEFPHGTYLGVVEAVEASYPFEREPQFVGWVGQSMRDLAIRKTREVTGQDPQHISHTEVEDITPPVR